MKLEQALGPLFKYYNQTFELIVDSYDDVYYLSQKEGELVDLDKLFKSESDVEQVARDLMKYANVEYSSDKHSYDFTIDKQTRVHVAFPPMSQKGPAINFLKIPKQSFDWDDMREWEVIREDGIKLITDAIKNGKNILVGGAAGSGKTTLLNICASSILPEWRVVSIERSPSLIMERKRYAKLMAPNNKVSEMPMLVEAASKMRADYIVHSYVEGPETMQFLELIREGIVPWHL